MIGVEAVLSQTIKNVEEKDFDLDRSINVDAWTTIDIYSFALYSQKGTMDIVFRTEHDGCYGGSLELTKNITLALTDLEELTMDYPL